MNKNYIIYSTDKVTVKRQPINSREVYPFANACNRIPNGANTIATIVGKPCYQSLVSSWHKPRLLLHNLTYTWIEDVEDKSYKDDQKDFRKHFWPMLTKEEKNHLKPMLRGI